MDMPSYEKDLENQNYDLMVRLAQTEEMLEDFRELQKDNEKYLEHIVVSCIDTISSLATTLHVMKAWFDENNVDFSEYINYDMVSDKAGRDYSKRFLETLNDSNGDGEYIKHTIHHINSVELYKEYIMKALKEL